MKDLRALLEMRQASPLSFSDDGRVLLVGSDVPGTRQLYAVPARGGEPQQLTRFDEPVAGQYLPDGRILLEIDAGGNERTQLYFLAAEPGAPPEALVVDERFTPRRRLDVTARCSRTSQTGETAPTSTSSRTTCARAKSRASSSGAGATWRRSRPTGV